ncbi:LysR family transcriptional regulator [Cupriavidus sp. EM10]|uniref:LysR family transcriptional regulator n=1 Tax=Cupriavidus sp. EM10 TaxID=2839983 RepID=UPI001CED5AFF|nr:LysR family transcriptional regulator [Cupriavidus sp. EM10]
MKSFATLTQMTVFARIAESGSLSAAARDLHLSPSAVSKSLAQLEERLGVLLVKRTTRSLTLTEGGRLFLERATSILSDVENTLDTARQFGHPHGNLKLSSSIAFGTKQLTNIVGRYLEAYPEVNANIILDDRYVNLSEENFDVALRITADTHWAMPQESWPASAGCTAPHPNIWPITPTSIIPRISRVTLAWSILP